MFSYTYPHISLVISQHNDQAVLDRLRNKLFLKLNHHPTIPKGIYLSIIYLSHFCKPKEDRGNFKHIVEYLQDHNTRTGSQLKAHKFLLGYLRSGRQEFQGNGPHKFYKKFDLQQRLRNLNILVHIIWFNCFQKEGQYVMHYIFSHIAEY